MRSLKPLKGRWLGLALLLAVGVGVSALAFNATLHVIDSAAPLNPGQPRSNGS